MRQLAVSNIAWPDALRSEALAILARESIFGLEVAPTMLWPDWQVTPGQTAASREELATQGFRVSSLQAILFAQPQALLFGDEAARQALAAHLERCAALAEQLGAAPLVFGAPKNRLRGPLPLPAAESLAADLFRQVAPAFARHGACLCLEANPADYGCDFMTSAADAARLVRAVAHPGVGLHLDTACMHLAGDDPRSLIETHADILRHVHVSEPFLGPFDSPVVDHAAIAAALRDIGYSGWVVLEMRATADPLAGLERAARFLAATYGSAHA